jgi:hypothetical protein
LRFDADPRSFGLERMHPQDNTMNAHPAAHPALPTPLRSEAFAEDLLGEVEAALPPPRPPLRWLVNLAPLAVAAMGVAVALVPPLS